MRDSAAVPVPPRAAPGAGEPMRRRGFASDNAAGVHPAVLAGIVAAEAEGPSRGGADAVLRRFEATMRRQFGSDARAVCALNGTGANVLALRAVLPRWGAVIVPTSAHLHRSEAGAIERVGGLKLLTVETPDGKLTPELIDREAWGWGDEHRAQPLAVSITQSTELGTLYTADEVRAIADHAHERGMRLHMDGARLPNAAVALGTSLRALTTDAGVDVLSLGGTKHGALAAEAVVVLGEEPVEPLEQVAGATMQVAPKPGLVAAQLIALYEGVLWRENAAHANAMAARLRAGLETLPGIAFAHATQANAVLARLPEPALVAVASRFALNARSAVRGQARLMCSWDTTLDDVDTFVAIAAAALRDA